MNAYAPATMRGDKPNLSGESTACQLSPLKKKLSNLFEAKNGKASQHHVNVKKYLKSVKY